MFLQITTRQARCGTSFSGANLAAPIQIQRNILQQPGASMIFE
jgi:hypothetical protein